MPFSRGPLRSLEPLKVIALLRSLSEEGYKEVVLTGIHLGKYGVDLSPATSLKDLLILIGKERLPLRIRLSSIEPKEVVPELIRMAASEEWLCRHFHIPLQSGDNDILKRMNRNYYIRRVCSARRIHSQPDTPGRNRGGHHGGFSGGR